MFPEPAQAIPKAMAEPHLTWGLKLSESRDTTWGHCSGVLGGTKHGQGSGSRGRGERDVKRREEEGRSRVREGRSRERIGRGGEGERERRIEGEEWKRGGKKEGAGNREREREMVSIHTHIAEQ